MALLILVTALAGFSELNLWIFGGDIALLAVSLALEPRVSSLTRKRGKKGILAQESPLKWLLGSTRFFFFSLAASVAYGIMNAETLASIAGFSPLWFFCGAVAFLAGGLLLVGRTVEWIFNPASITNIRMGKAMMLIGKWGGGVTLYSLILLFQTTVSVLTVDFLQRIFILHLGLSPVQIGFFGACIISYAGFFPVSLTAILHPNEPFNRRHIIPLVVFFLPWLYIIALGIFVALGV